MDVFIIIWKITREKSQLRNVKRVNKMDKKSSSISSQKKEKDILRNIIKVNKTKMMKL